MSDMLHAIRWNRARVKVESGAYDKSELEALKALLGPEQFAASCLIFEKFAEEMDDAFWGPYPSQPKTIPYWIQLDVQPDHIVEG